MNEVLLDATRLIARSWSRRQPTGIDRVCLAYLRQFSERARLVVQHKGLVRVLTYADSAVLADMLLDRDSGFRSRLARFAPKALARGSTAVGGATYINVSHTDFDLEGHARWITRNRLNSIYLIHDLIPITHSDHCRPHAVRRHRGRVLGALRHGAGIVVSTGVVRRDLASFAAEHDIRMPPVLVAPLQGARLPSASPHELADSPYFLCVGTIESRKNHVLLLEVWRRLVRMLGPNAPKLVIAGQWGQGSDGVRRALDSRVEMQDRVEVIEGCSDRELGRLLSGARALLMPSLAEGFGLPMTEALSAGTPVIASNLPCFREIGQGIPCLLDPFDPAPWTRMIAQFDYQNGERARQLSMMRHYSGPTWEDHFARFDTWLPTLPKTDSAQAFGEVDAFRVAASGLPKHAPQAYCVSGR